MSDQKKSIVEWKPPLDQPALVVNTQFGERQLRTAVPNEAFWYKWRHQEDSLKEKGVSVRKDEKTGEFVIEWWAPIKAKNQAQRLEMSEAHDSSRAIPVPDGLDYLPYQRAGIAYALDTPGTLIADEMGLGKTIQAIGVINADPSLMRVLIICPATLKLNWRNELNRWLVRPHSVEIAEGKSWPSHFGAADDGETEITIINYDILTNHSPVIHRREWDLVIADEAHYLKNSKAQRTKVIFGGGRGKARTEPIRSRRFLALSGTPILNRPVEIWTVVHYLAPHEFPNFYQFAKRFCGGEPGFGGSIDTSGASNLDELQTKLRRSCMVRRLKKDVLKELPAKVRQVIELPPSDQIRRILDRERQQWQLREDSIRALETRRDRARVSGDEDDYKNATRELREAATVAFTEMSAVRREIAVQKIPFVVQSLKSLLESTDEKIVVMAHHHEMVDALCSQLAQYGVVKIDGRMTDKAARQRAVEDFQKNPRIRLFVGSIKAAGVGITLTASRTVVFAELDWVPGNMDQCEDRCHRIGQEDTVLVQYLVLEGSIDALMAKRLVEKKDVINAALNDGKGTEVEERDCPDDAPEITVGQKAPSKYLEIGRRMTEDQRELAHHCVKLIAAKDGDRASAVNGQGFSKLDSDLGHQFAEMSNITVAQAGLCRTLALKYRRQLPQHLIERLDERSS